MRARIPPGILEVPSISATRSRPLGPRRNSLSQGNAFVRRHPLKAAHLIGGDEGATAIAIAGPHDWRGLCDRALGLDTSTIRPGLHSLIDHALSACVPEVRI